MKRRDFIKSLPLGVAATAIPFSVGGLFSGKAFSRSPILDALLNVQSATENILVIINLQGGNDGLNTIIPYQDEVYIKNRGSIGYVNPNDVALLKSKFRPDLAMNPPLDSADDSAFFKMFLDGKLAIVQNVGYANPNRSHFRATDIWNTASDSDIIISTGWVGRYLEKQAPPTYPIGVQPGDDPLAIQIDYSTSLAFQGSKAVMASAVSDPSTYSGVANYNDSTPPDTNFGTELSYIRAIMTESNVYGSRFKSVFSATGSTTTTVNYPKANPLALALQKVAWCIKGGLSTRVYFVTLGGFDTHASQNSKDPTINGQGKLHQQLGEAITLFQKDMEGLGVADRVLGMTYSEFGRRVNQNNSSGTDHGTAAPMFLFGTQVNGELYGHNPDLVNLDPYGDLVEEFDFRKIYSAILTQWFGADDSLRKSILNKPDFTTASDFKDSANGFMFPVNGQTKMQNLLRNPVNSVPSAASDSFILYQNQPNPFRETTTIPFALSEAGRTTLEVFDSRGTLVANLLDSYMPRGSNQIIFDGRILPSGTYFVRLEVSGKTQTQKISLIK